MINGIDPDKQPNQLHLSNTGIENSRFTTENQVNLNKKLKRLKGTLKKIRATEGTGVEIVDVRKSKNKQIKGVDANGHILHARKQKVINSPDGVTPRAAYIIEKAEKRRR